LIADYPWLLNLDYEIIPELKNKGMEYQLSESKRADLILKDRKSGRGSCWSFSINKLEFFENVKKSIEPFILNYIKIMNNLKLME